MWPKQSLNLQSFEWTFISTWNRRLKTSSTVSQLLWNSLAKRSSHCPPVTGPCRRLETITYIYNRHKQSGTAPLNSALVMSNVGINAVQHCELKLQFVGAHALKYVFLHYSITDHSLITLYLAHGPERRLLMNIPRDPSSSLRTVLRQSCVMLQQCRSTNYESDIKVREIRLGQSNVSVSPWTIHTVV